jgi:hypothetical protein
LLGGRFESIIKACHPRDRRLLGGQLMFEPVKCFLRCLESLSSWGRLNKTLFLMLIDSSSRTVSHSRGKSAFNIASNFIRPNQ